MLADFLLSKARQYQKGRSVETSTAKGLRPLAFAVPLVSRREQSVRISGPSTEYAGAVC